MIDDPPDNANMAAAGLVASATGTVSVQTAIEDGFRIPTKLAVPGKIFAHPGGGERSHEACLKVSA